MFTSHCTDDETKANPSANNLLLLRTRVKSLVVILVSTRQISLLAVRATIEKTCCSTGTCLEHRQLQMHARTGLMINRKILVSSKFS